MSQPRQDLGDEQRNALIASFCECTEAVPDVAANCLRAANWNLDSAIDGYFRYQAGEITAPVQQQPLLASQPKKEEEYIPFDSGLPAPPSINAHRDATRGAQTIATRPSVQPLSQRSFKDINTNPSPLIAQMQPVRRQPQPQPQAAPQRPKMLGYGSLGGGDDEEDEFDEFDEEEEYDDDEEFEAMGGAAQFVDEDDAEIQKAMRESLKENYPAGMQQSEKVRKELEAAEQEIRQKEALANSRKRTLQQQQEQALLQQKQQQQHQQQVLHPEFAQNQYNIAQYQYLQSIATSLKVEEKREFFSQLIADDPANEDSGLTAAISHIIHVRASSGKGQEYLEKLRAASGDRVNMDPHILGARAALEQAQQRLIVAQAAVAAKAFVEQQRQQRPRIEPPSAEQLQQLQRQSIQPIAVARPVSQPTSAKKEEKKEERSDEDQEGQ